MRHGDLESARCGVVEMYWLFNEENRCMPRQTGEYLLRSLPHKIPPKVTLDDKRVVANRKRIAGFEI